MKKLDQLQNGDFIDFDEVVAVQIYKQVSQLGIGPSVIVVCKQKVFTSSIEAECEEQAKQLCQEISEKINESR